jgi:hypothetical protein
MFGLLSCCGEREAIWSSSPLRRKIKRPGAIAHAALRRVCAFAAGQPRASRMRSPFSSALALGEPVGCAEDQRGGLVQGRQQQVGKRIRVRALHPPFLHGQRQRSREHAQTMGRDDLSPRLPPERLATLHQPHALELGRAQALVQIPLDAGFQRRELVGCAGHHLGELGDHVQLERFEHRAQQLVLAGEVVIQPAAADPRATHHLARAEARIALLGHQLARHPDDPPARGSAALLAFAGVRLHVHRLGGSLPTDCLSVLESAS